MTQVASVAYIGKAAGAPPELQGFIGFRASMARRELGGDEPVAVLRIGDTDSHHVFFLDGGLDLPGIEKELGTIEAVLGVDARHHLEEILEKLKKGK